MGGMDGGSSVTGKGHGATISRSRKRGRNDKGDDVQVRAN